VVKRPPEEFDDLDQVANAFGIASRYEGTDGEIVQVSEAAKRAMLAALGIDLETTEQPARSIGAGASAQGSAATADHDAGKCFMPDWLVDGRCWGVTCQLYGMRSERNCGIGDFSDLATLGEILASEGADFVGVSPLHALFSAAPRRFSPYSPSSRRFLNPLYISIDSIETEPHTPPAGTNDLRRADLVDYAGVAAIKRAELEAMFQRFRSNHYLSGSAADNAFERYRRRRGSSLRDFARFEAISEMAVATSGEEAAAGWTTWPTELQDKASDAVAEFERSHEDRILYHCWLQWVAETELAAVQNRLKAAGMRIGLYLDLAVGVAPDGAETWSEPTAVLSGARIGAPPDPFNRQGQNWGLAPLSPRAMTTSNADIFREVLTENMRHAGAVRLDHVMALERLFLVPEGHAASDGAYLQYPLDRMLDETVAISNETGTVVIGEDLGTVRPGFRKILRDSEIESYRVLLFERTDDGDFKPPAEWPRHALACAATHDMATLLGWWRADDLDTLVGIGLIDSAERSRLLAARENDRQKLVEALAHERLLESALPAEVAAEHDRLAVAIHRYLARTPCRLLAVQLEDLIGMTVQANVPGTIDEHPNWRRRLPIDLAELPRHPLFRAIVACVASERPR